MDKTRLPSGQRLIGEDEFPVLDLGVKPDFTPEAFKFEITGLVETPLKLTYQQLLEMSTDQLTADFHCVTRWSKYDVHWEGVLWNRLLELTKPKSEATHVLQTGLDGYTTNSSLEELEQSQSFLATKLDGQPIPLEHGAPARMIIPHLYGWKGSKFLSKIEFLAEDKKGFWEMRGYHNRGRAFEEERYS